MASMFPPDDPLAREIVTAYTDAWGRLSPELRAKLRAGVDYLEDLDVAELAQGPHPPMTLSYWLSNPEGHRWDISHTFAEWARRGAPGPG